MMGVKSSGALIKGAPRSRGLETVKAKILRGVFVRGTPYPPGAIVEVTMQEFSELRNANYVTAATQEDLAHPTPEPERPTLTLKRKENHGG